MGKGIVSLHPQECFENHAFQEQYIRHKKLFTDKYGVDIDLLFADDYKAKIYFYGFYSDIEKRRFYEAYRHLKASESLFRTEAEKQIYEKFEKICRNREEMDEVTVGDRIKSESGFIYTVLKAKNGTFLIKNIFDARKSLRFDGNNHFISERFEFSKKLSLEESNLDFFSKITDEEQAKIDAHFTLRPEDIAKIDRFTDKFLEYREKLLAYGMVNPKNRLRTEIERFYKYTSDQTAFAINIDDHGDHLLIGYGVTTVSLASDYRSFFEENGGDNDNMTIRRCIKIKSEAEEAEAAERIKVFFAEYGSFTKDEILARSKEMRKEFLKVITDKLKPLGFKKKSNHWLKPLENGFYIEFYADKSQYSDQYQFDIYLFRENIIPRCYYNVPKYNKDCAFDGTYFNWQFTSREAFARLLDEGVLPIIEHILETPQNTWADDESISGLVRLCDRSKCEYCPFRK